MSVWKLSLTLSLVVVAAACADKQTPSSPSAPSVSKPANLTAPKLDSPSDDAQLNTVRPTLVVQNGTSDQATGTRSYEFQISTSSDFSTIAGAAATFQAVISKTGVPEDPSGKTKYTLDSDLQPTTRFYWRARMAQDSATSPWSNTGMFRSKLVGYLRAGELYDPLIFGETVGVRVGNTSFIQGKGIRLNDGTSYVSYLLPQTISAGEFSMEVEGLQTNAPGNKAKVFGMQEGQDDFVTNRFRVDVQYRGTEGVPPNCIQWRAMFGDDNHRIEPDTDVRMASVYNLVSSQTYYFKATWSNGFRLQIWQGNTPTGSSMYDQAKSIGATYSPNPHYAYLGAPTGRSGVESASIANTIYRNVWLSTRPRPASVGSALRPPTR